MQSGNKNTAVLVRRIIAIALMALSLGCLFWPSMIGLSAEYKEQLRDSLPSDRDAENSIKGSIDSGFASLEHENSRYLRYTGSELPKLPIDQNDANKDAMTVFRTVKDGELSVAETCLDLSIAAKYAKTIMDYADQAVAALERGMQETLGSRAYEYLKSGRDNVVKAQEQYRSYVIIGQIAAIAIVVLFFGMIAFGVLAIVLMILNRPNLNLVHAILALLCTGVYVFLIVFGNDRLPEMARGAQNNMLTPGVSLFLMPIFSIASCFVYKSNRVKKSTYKGAGVIEKDAAPWQPNLYYPEQQQPWQEQPAQPLQPQQWQSAQTPMLQPNQESAWTCEHCGTKNAESSAFCTNCGGQKPIPMPKQESTWTCILCGAENAESAEFCASCGVQKPAQQPKQDGMWTCMTCGAKNAESAAFCINCGGQKPAQQSNTVFCASCGKPINAELPFCPYCGTKQA